MCYAGKERYGAVSIPIRDETNTMYHRALGISIVALGAVTGIGLGVGMYTFVYAKGFSYMHDDPAVCANCHIMQNHYDAWAKSSHQAVAVCNDCHTASGLIPKYVTKAINGFNHSLAFTTGNFHEPIQANPFNQRITEASCRECHQDIVHQIDFGGGGGEPMSCIRCHRFVGHFE